MVDPCLRGPDHSGTWALSRFKTVQTFRVFPSNPSKIEYLQILWISITFITFRCHPLQEMLEKFAIFVPLFLTVPFSPQILARAARRRQVTHTATTSRAVRSKPGPAPQRANGQDRSGRRCHSRSAAKEKNSVQSRSLHFPRPGPFRTKTASC